MLLLDVCDTSGTNSALWRMSQSYPSCAWQLRAVDTPKNTDSRVLDDIRHHTPPLNICKKYAVTTQRSTFSALDYTQYVYKSLCPYHTLEKYCRIRQYTRRVFFYKSPYTNRLQHNTTRYSQDLRAQLPKDILLQRTWPQGLTNREYTCRAKCWVKQNT